MNWWRNAVLYEVYLRSFKDSNGNGLGDLEGVRSKLDYFEWLGIEGIWITPFFPSPMVDFGYDVSDYCSVDPRFGTIEDFHNLLEDAHGRNIKVIIDFVPNHTADQHPWFLDSRSSRTAEKRDWYIWANPKKDGSPPSNWQSRFGGGPAWTLDEVTGQYYMHSFLPEQPDLNWNNKEVQKAMLDTMRFWLNMGVDGIRVDVCDRLIKDKDLRDNPPNPHWKEGQDPARKLLQPYSKNLPQMREINRLLRGVANEYHDVCLIGESYLPIEQLSAYYGENDEYHLPFNFALTLSTLKPEEIKDALRRAGESIPNWACPSWAFGNHDRSRVASRVGHERAKVAMMLLLTLQGAPTLYYGDELGLEDVDIPKEKLVDPWGLATPSRARDKVRTPMPWDKTANAGFCEETVEPWLPLNSNYNVQNVSSLVESPNSILNLTRTLIELRKTYPTLRNGKMNLLDTNNSNEIVYERRSDQDHFIIQLNFGDTAIDIVSGEVIFCSELNETKAFTAPFEGVITKRQIVLTGDR